MDKVSNLEIYVQRMEKSLLDKLFFIDKMFEPVETVLDFGCANGVLIKMMQQFFPEYGYIGYDIAPEMIEIAKETIPDAVFHTQWEDIRCNPEKTLVNISSTLHEVYHYGTPADVELFWDRIFGSGFQYIAIRDMMLTENLDPQSDPADVEKARKLFPEKLAEYESIYGSITQRFHLIHYLLKYRYTENWDREVRENYLPITREALLRKIPEHYEIVWDEHYTLPYIRHQIEKDSGIVLRDHTHYKILLKLKK